MLLNAQRTQKQKRATKKNPTFSSQRVSFIRTESPLKSSVCAQSEPALREHTRESFRPFFTRTLVKRTRGSWDESPFKQCGFPSAPLSCPRRFGRYVRLHLCGLTWRLHWRSDAMRGSPRNSAVNWYTPPLFYIQSVPRPELAARPDTWEQNSPIQPAAPAGSQAFCFLFVCFLWTRTELQTAGFS